MNDQVRRVYKFRCYPTVQQIDALERQLRFACELYNAALEQRRLAWREHRIAITLKQQSKELTDLRATGTDLWPPRMSRSAMQKTLERLDCAFVASIGARLTEVQVKRPRVLFL